MLKLNCNFLENKCGENECEEESRQDVEKALENYQHYYSGFVEADHPLHSNLEGLALNGDH